MLFRVPALEMFRSLTKLYVAFTVPLTLDRIPERCLSLKSLHPVDFLVPIKRIEIARLTCVWGSSIPNYYLIAKGNGALGGAYPAGPREKLFQRSM